MIKNDYYQIIIAVVLNGLRVDEENKFDNTL